MAVNYFFTESSKLNSQAAGKGFGPISQNEDTQFRVCSLHTASSSPKAIAINDGTVAVQKIPGSSPAKVNLILKPYSQGTIDGFRIKYFIYRGILESSLFNGSEIASSTNNDLTKLLWDNQNAHNTRTGDTGNPPEDLLGIQYQALAGNESVEKLFFDNASDFVNPCVFAAWHIGDFDETEFGIQVVTENYHSDLDLSKVRVLDHIINIAAFPTSGSDKAKYENKALREAALSYIDPSAFYGLNFESGVRAIDGSGSFSTKKGLDIYNDLLVGSSTTTPYFLNFDVLYIDFRNDKGLSKNFYEDNYSYDLSSFLFSGESTSATKNFSTNDWPLLIIRSSDHPNASNISNEKYVSLLFDYPITTDEVSNALFLATGSRIEFNTLELEKEPQNQSRVLDITPAVGGGTALLLKIGSPYDSNNSNLCSYYIRLQTFESLKTSATPSANHLLAINPLDNCFIIPKDEKTVNSGEVLIQKTGHTKYINLGNNRLSAVFEFGVAWEENRVIFFGMPIAYKSKNDNIPIPFSFDDNLWPFSSFYEFAAEFLKGLKVAKHELNLTGGNKKVVRLVEELFTDYWQSNEHDVISIAISRTEFQNIQTAITNSNLDQGIHPVFLNYDLTTGTDSNSVDYSKADLKLVGFEDDGTTISELHVNPTSANLADAYAADLFSFSTDDAADIEGVNVSNYSRFFEIEYTSALTTAITNAGLNQVTNSLEQMETFLNKAKKICKSVNAKYLKFDAQPLAGANAATSRPSISGIPDTIVIEISSTYIAKTTEVSLVRTIIHELMHGYVKFLMESKDIIESSTYPFFDESERKKLKEDLFGIYDFFCRFSVKDTADERDYDHNYMAYIQRKEILSAIKEFDDINNTTSRSGQIEFIDKFNSGTPNTSTYTTWEFYNALSWAGLIRTRTWRELARKNKTKALMYVAILFREQEGGSGSVSEPINLSIPVSAFDYVTNPIQPVCEEYK